MNPTYGPGSLVRARGREWIVLPGGEPDTLRVRPLAGSEDEQTLIHLGLELEAVTEASFPPPAPRPVGNQETARLLQDALMLSLRRGAGPFRSFGQIAVEPRAYQLVPLLMALKLDTVRLLVADDVGIGKTIEAALIAREFVDRGDATRVAVLCPPHLVEQWVTELETRFHLHAVPVTAASAARLERGLPQSENIFSAHPVTVVSLDYIKSDRRRDEFARTCPDFVIVDEAHTCAGGGGGRHQRYELLKKLAQSASRHMVLLTATPHSGDDAAFQRLLGLLDPEFEKLADASGEERTRLRERLAHHFVQRRRPDIDEWKEGRLFPRRETMELTYALSGESERFFNAVLDYCVSVVESAGGDERRRRLNFWGTLALMRCVASSPAAARQALRTRAGLEDEIDEAQLEARVFDGAEDALEDDDVEPAAGGDDPALAALIEQAESLVAKKDDAKLRTLVTHVKQLLDEGFSPVVFCRFIATAHFLEEVLSATFKKVTVKAVTGELSSHQREEAVDALGKAETRLLVATDCLSEGINLQEHFDAVVHYDLSWNPTRHEQREGRVDRFGQEREVVRTTLLYGANNPVDGAVLEVILRKAARIREELGVPVPLPDAGDTLTHVLMKAMLLRASPNQRNQQTFDFMALPEAKALDAQWVDAAAKAKANRTVFAQRRLKPADVLPEWRKTLGALGGEEDVKRFTTRALARLGSGLDAEGRGYTTSLEPLPEEVRERLEAEGLDGTIRLDFAYPPARRCLSVHRSHPLVSVLAESLLERTLGGDLDSPAADPSVLGRVGCWVGGVATRTTVALVRMRHQITHKRGDQVSTLLVEEAGVVAWTGQERALVAGDAALSLLAASPLGDVPPVVQTRSITQALEELNGQRAALEAFAQQRAQALLADHRRVREAADARGSYAVTALPPVDVVGLFVLLPKVS